MSPYHVIGYIYVWCIGIGNAEEVWIQTVGGRDIAQERVLYQYLWETRQAAEFKGVCRTHVFLLSWVAK
jgi:hypothetical protein